MTEAVAGKKLKILLVHNRYQQRGGEDAVFEEEISLLRSRGHDVETFELSNDEIKTPIDSVQVAIEIQDSPGMHRRVQERIRASNPDVVHIHNFFPLLTPSAHEAVSGLGVPVVQTFHNYRFACANAQFLRGGKPCVKCLLHGPKWGVIHGCYRDSRLASFPVSRMIRKLRSPEWQCHVDRFIALTDFARTKMIEAGFPGANISVVPNSLSLKAAVREKPSKFTILFVGRLAEEKGAQNLISAFAGIAPGKAILKVVGDGPLRADLESFCRRSKVADVEFLGRKTLEETKLEMSRASVLALPSIWFEGFPMVLVEAMSQALPVIASRIGGIPEIVQDRKTGLLCEPSRILEWTEAFEKLIADPALLNLLSAGALSRFQSEYTSEIKVSALEGVYREAIAHRKSSGMSHVS